VLAVVVVRDGVLPAGGDEAVAEAGGAAILIGRGAEVSAAALVGSAGRVRAVEAEGFAPAGWADALAPLLEEEDVVILPASPDGRDLAPRLAAALRRPLLAGAILVTPSRAVLVRQGGLVAEEHAIDGPVVATLVPGSRGVDPVAGRPAIESVDLRLDPAVDAEVVELVPPDPATVDLAEATRILAGGAGLGGPEPFALLARVAAALGASLGASRVASDLGWAPHDRYIGTTGVAVDPQLYVAFAISGAVQHVTGLGHPEHIVSVNTDPSAPMMAMADLAIVADANAVLGALAVRLAVERMADD
jgi:electron transfer flavoprotein alpha subunit